MKKKVLAPVLFSGPLSALCSPFLFSVPLSRPLFLSPRPLCFLFLFPVLCFPSSLLLFLFLLFPSSLSFASSSFPSFFPSCAHTHKHTNTQNILVWTFALLRFCEKKKPRTEHVHRTTKTTTCGSCYTCSKPKEGFTRLVPTLCKTQTHTHKRNTTQRQKQHREKRKEKTENKDTTTGTCRPRYAS